MTEPAARWWRRWWLRPSPGAGSAPGSVDLDVEWRPGATPLTGDWAQAYERCRSSVSAYDRVVATMDPGPLRGRLTELRADLETPQALAAGLASLGHHLSPGSARRAGWFADGTGSGGAARPASGSADRSAAGAEGDGRAALGPTPAESLVEHLDRLRAELDDLADAAARIAVLLLDNPRQTDVPALLAALAHGLVGAVQSGYLPVGLHPGDPG